MPNATLKTSVQAPSGKLSAKRRLKQREAWLHQIAPTSQFHTLFDNLPDLHFFAKDRNGRLMFLSRSQRERYGINSEADVIGLTDFDLNPGAMAEGYVLDDMHIYKTGEPILRRVELWWDARGIPDWYVVTKLPIRSRKGSIIGIMGVLQRYEGQARLAMPWREIDAAVRHIRENFREHVSVKSLAKLTKLSGRQLERKFQTVLGVSPQEFLIKTRVLAACHALRETNEPLSDIGVNCGFYDQSSFTEHFRRHVGQTPREFRKCAIAQRSQAKA